MDDRRYRAQSGYALYANIVANTDTIVEGNNVRRVSITFFPSNTGYYVMLGRTTIVPMGWFGATDTPFTLTRETVGTLIEQEIHVMSTATDTVLLFIGVY